MRPTRLALISVATAALVGLIANWQVAWALVQTSLGGVVSIGDATTAGQQMTVNSDGSINAALTSGSTVSGTSAIYIRTNAGIVNAPATPFPVDLTPLGAAMTNCSGIIASTGVPQTASAANAARRAFQIQNTSTHAMAWSDMITNPTVGNAASSWQLAATTGSYTAPAHMVPTSAITVVGTSGDAFTCQTR